MRTPVCEAVRLTRRAISPRLAIRMERRGSVAGAALVLVCRMLRLGWRAAVVLRRARSLDGVDIVEDVGNLLTIGNGGLTTYMAWLPWELACLFARWL